jgi:hypothetical protein
MGGIRNCAAAYLEFSNELDRIEREAAEKTLKEISG